MCLGLAQWLEHLCQMHVFVRRFLLQHEQHWCALQSVYGAGATQCMPPHSLQMHAWPNTHLTFTVTGRPPGGTAFCCMICLCTCSLHLIISVGQTTMDENTPDMLPAMPCCQGFRHRSSLTPKKRWTILTFLLYARKRTAFSFVAVITAGTAPA